MSYSPASGFDGGGSLIKKMSDATRCNIISIDTSLNSVLARAYRTRSSTVWMKLSISGTCSFLDA